MMTIEEIKKGENVKYSVTDEFFTATVYRKNVPNVPENVPNVPENVPNVPKNVPNVPENVPNLTEREQNIVDIIKENPRITAKEISLKLNVNEKTVKRDISAMKEKNILIREGGKNGGRWLVIENLNGEEK